MDSKPALATIVALLFSGCVGIAELDVNPAGLRVPYIVGKFQRVYAPAGGRYINDHTLVRGNDGVWHVYGITHHSAGSPHEERSFLHGTAPSLQGPWRDEADVLMAQEGEQVLWAPHVFFAPHLSQWVMFYWGGAGLRQALSFDLIQWARRPAMPPIPGGRDPFVFRDGNLWFLYSVSVSSESRGQIIVSQSEDLRGWDPPAVAIEDPVPNFGWGNLESPFVVKYHNIFYLFLTRTGPASIEYNRTLVFASRDPRVFRWTALTQLPTHAAEIIEDQGRWFITSAGWTSHLQENNRGLSITELQWTFAQ